MVRLITHNLLACHAKGCTSNNFPLRFQDVTQIEVRDAELNPEFLKRFIPRLEWTALVDSAKQVRLLRNFSNVAHKMQIGNTSLPLSQPDMLDDDFLQTLHHVLLEIHIEQGAMVCPGCGHVYPILNGIPNMVRLRVSFASS